MAVDVATGTEVVYLIQGGPYFKIGRTRNLAERLRYAQTFTPTALKVLVTWHVPRHTRLLESYLHRRFSHVRMSGEWFGLSNDDVSSLLAIDQWDIELLRQDLARGAAQPQVLSSIAMAPTRKRQIRRKGRLYTCLRCGWQWKTLSGKRPKRCAQVDCRSPYWDQPRVETGDLRDGR